MFGLLSKQYIVDIFLRIQICFSDNCIRYLIRNLLHYYNDGKKNEDEETDKVKIADVLRGRLENAQSLSREGSVE